MAGIPRQQVSEHRAWIYGALSGVFRPKFDGTLVEWADGRLKIPSSTRFPVFVAGESPWLLEPMRALCDPKIKRVDFRAPTGAAKSLVGEMFLAYIIDNEPGLTYYVCQKDEAAKDAMEDRIIPMLEQNRFLAERLPVDPNKRRITKISFPTMPLYALGANINNAQAKRVRYLIMDEPHCYAPGIMSALVKRCDGVRSPKILTLSTGSVKDDESDKSFNEGSCEEWEVPCPHCGVFQQMKDERDRLRSDRTAETVDAEGNIIWSKLLPTVRYNCESCGRDWPKDQKSRHEQAQRGRYTVTNTNAAQDHRSFHLEAASVHWIELDIIVQEKLIASFASRRGNVELLKDYIQKRKAGPWDESPPDDEGRDDERMKGAYFLNEKPEPDALARFLTIDNQAGRASKGEGAHRWYVCREFGPSESRLVDCGRITSWEEMEETRIRLGVLPARTLVDIAWDTQAVQSVCVRYGWQGLWGDNSKKKSFPHHETVNGPQGPQRVVRQYPFSSVNIGHVGLGSGGIQRQARYFFWAGAAIKNQYHRLKDGLATYRWTCPQNTPKEYFEHLKNEHKRMEIDNAGNKIWVWFNPPKKPNHLLDCDQMCLVSALMDSRLRGILLLNEDTPINTTAHEAIPTPT
jgi:phage terminase large subunit GpA-like protein